MIECYGICSENCISWQNGKCVLDAKKAEVIYDFETKHEKIITSPLCQTKGNIMTHNTTQAEKMEFLNKIQELTLSNILQKEDIEEIQKILLNACNRTLSDIR